MSNYQQLRLSSLFHLHGNVLLILSVVAFKRDKAFITKRLTAALKCSDHKNLTP